jgi:hypothetical protein
MLELQKQREGLVTDNKMCSKQIHSTKIYLAKAKQKYEPKPKPKQTKIRIKRAFA